MDDQLAHQVEQVVQALEIHFQDIRFLGYILEAVPFGLCLRGRGFRFVRRCFAEGVCPLGEVYRRAGIFSKPLEALPQDGGGGKQLLELFVIQAGAVFEQFFKDPFELVHVLLKGLEPHHPGISLQSMKRAQEVRHKLDVQRAPA